MGPCFIGIDVGTGSARAGIFDAQGHELASASRPIRTWRPEAFHAEQSSGNIWQASCDAVKEVMEMAGLAADAIKGIGFDATCSLVVLDEAGNPVAVNQDGDDDRNIVLWMDQRAREEAREINETGARVLDYVGGRISPEMETPKILWLSRHLSKTVERAAHFLDLADFLTFKATGSLTRSICTLTCKWTYLAHENKWDRDYFETIGLGPLAEDDFARIGTEVSAPGTTLASGLTAQAATELGLNPGTAVGVGMIDAHAGAIGTLGAEGLPGAIGTRLAYVFGTSACTLNVTAEPAFVPGVWGPYKNALLPDLWLNEGGQSAAGGAIDHLVQSHPFSPRAQKEAAKAGQSLTQWLESRARLMLEGASPAEMVAGIHVVPEFLGNRAPFADPAARAVIAGLGLEGDEDSLVRLYIAGVMSIGYGLRQILDALSAQGVEITSVVISGGAARSRLVRRLLADAADIAIATVETDEPVLLGSAMLGAMAAGHGLGHLHQQGNS
ncbi:FGGY-family carbohydrate kinase, partial [Devosia sp.]|uniref:FGGY-family carbohydrate kinase n=1 Tax=Devosia sp. TaxID=1871048 RepID=UPI002AFFE81E